MEFWKCFIYLAITGAAGFLLGRLLPKEWFHWDQAPFQSLPFERDGELYEALHVRRWQNLMPDMSRIFPGMMPPKNLTGQYRQRLPRMLQETCVAEMTHSLLCITGLYVLKLWRGIGGVIVYLLYAGLMNLPYIIIQRYNRPRLRRLYHRLAQNEGVARNAGYDSDLQYRPGT